MTPLPLNSPQLKPASSTPYTSDAESVDAASQPSSPSKVIAAAAAAFPLRNIELPTEKHTFSCDTLINEKTNDSMTHEKSQSVSSKVNALIHDFDFTNGVDFQSLSASTILSHSEQEATLEQKKHAVKTIQKFVRKHLSRKNWGAETLDTPYKLHRQWNRIYFYIDNFVKHHPDLSIRTKGELSFFAIQYLCKVANIIQQYTTETQLDTTPLQNKHAYVYQRNYVKENKLLTIATTITEKLLGTTFKPDELILLGSPSLPRELMNATYFLSMTNVAELSTTVNLNISRLHSSIVHVSNKLRAGIPTLYPRFFIALKINPTNDPVTLVEELNKQKYALLNALKAKIHQFANTIPDAYEAKKSESILLSDLLKGITFGLFTQFNHLDLLVLPQYDEDVSYADKNEFIRELVVQKGFTPTMQELERYIAANVDLEEIPQLFKLNLGEQKRILRIKHPVKNYEAFIGHKIFKMFNAHFSKSQQGSYALLTKSMALLLEGLSEIHITKSFQKLGMTKLLQSSLGRVLTYMDTALRSKMGNNNDMETFGNTFDLIFEELLLILTITKPYSKEQLEVLIIDKVSVNSSIKPAMVRFTSSGVKAAAEIVRTLLSLTQNTHILTLDDCYYESHLRHKDLVATNRASLEYLKTPHYEVDLHEDTPEAPQKPIDIVFVDPHPNICAVKLDSQSHQVKSIITKIIEKKRLKLNKPLTVVIDNTIGYINSQEINDLIQTYKHAIQNKNLNIIVYSSAQKFDMFGSDKLSGGYYAVYTAFPQLVECFKKLQQLETEDEINIQGFHHLFQHTASELDAYRAQTFKNAQFLYDQIDVRHKYNPSDNNELEPLYVLPKNDAANFYIELYTPMPNISRIVRVFLHGKIESAQWPLTERDSFGFKTSVFAFISSEKLRFSVGHEKPEVLQQYGAFINEMASYLKELYTLLKSRSHLLGVDPKNMIEGFLTSCVNHKIQANKYPTQSETLQLLEVEMRKELFRSDITQTNNALGNEPLPKHTQEALWKLFFLKNPLKDIPLDIAITKEEIKALIRKLERDELQPLFNFFNENAPGIFMGLEIVMLDPFIKKCIEIYEQQKASPNDDEMMQVLTSLCFGI